MTSGSFGMRPRITRTDTSDGNNIIGMKNGRLEIQDARSFFCFCAITDLYRKTPAFLHRKENTY